MGKRRGGEKLKCKAARMTLQYLYQLHKGPGPYISSSVIGHGSKWPFSADSSLEGDDSYGLPKAVLPTAEDISLYF